jgi:hypothetical protein
MFDCPRPHAPNPFLVRRGPIRYSTPRGHPRYTRDVVGAPDAIKDDAGTHLPTTIAHIIPSRLSFVSSLPSRVSHPSATTQVIRALRHNICLAWYSTTIPDSLAAGGSPSFARTRRPLSPSTAHRRCSTVCLVGLAGHTLLPPLPL